MQGWASPSSSQPLGNLARLEGAEQLAVPGVGSCAPLASDVLEMKGDSTHVLPAGLWVNPVQDKLSLPDSQSPEYMKFLCFVCLFSNRKHYLAFLLFTFSDDETGFKNTPRPSVKGVMVQVAHSWGGRRAPLHLISPFCLNIMPHPD